MRIAHILPPAVSFDSGLVGGVAHHARYLAKAQQRMHHMVDLVPPPTSLQTPESLHAHYVPTMKRSAIRHYFARNNRHHAEVARYARKNTSAFLHVHDPQVLTNFPRGEHPYVVTLHADHDYTHELPLLREDLAKRVAHLVTVTAYHQKKFKDTLGIDVPVIIYNGINTSSFLSHRPKKDYLILLSTIAPAKGQRKAITAARAAGYSLVLAGPIGDPDYFASLKPHMLNLCAEPDPVGAFNRLDRPSIAYVGHVQEPQKKELLSRARAFLMPFDSDSFPYVGLESLAAGTPVITYDQPLMRELFAEGKTGYLVDSVAGMARAAHAAHKLSPLACRRDAYARFSIDTTAESYLNLYDRMALLDPRTLAKWAAHLM